jgi:hypothetical protein
VIESTHPIASSGVIFSQDITASRAILYYIVFDAWTDLVNDDEPILDVEFICGGSLCDGDMKFNRESLPYSGYISNDGTSSVVMNVNGVDCNRKLAFGIGESSSSLWYAH